ncbi:MAG: DUF4351 domain-containing protein [Armatimonadota bacterium]|nr:DUF4351 domain-containing protein [Armatimonadota bacterium]
MTPPTLIDRSVKILIRDHPDAMSRLLNLNISPEHIRTDDVSVNVPEFRSDQLFVIEGAGDPPKWGLQGECQLEPDKRAVQGWFLKNAALNSQRDYPVLLVVIYLTRGKHRTFPSSYTITAGNIKNVYRFHVIRLWEHIDRIRNGDLGALAPLLVLCEDHPTEATLQEARAIIRRLDVDEGTRTGLFALSVMVGRRHFAENVLYAIFQEELPMIKELSFVQEWIEESKAEGRVEGRNEGMDEGRDEGRNLEARQFTLRLLRERFGMVPESLVSRIENADASWCEELAVRSLKSNSLQELS